MCHGSPCDLPFCTYRTKGGGIGRKKSSPSEPGRDEREAEYMSEHPFCETKGHEKVLSVHCHHVEKRGLGGWNRKKSPLQALCAACHLKLHGQ